MSWIDPKSVKKHTYQGVKFETFEEESSSGLTYWKAWAHGIGNLASAGGYEAGSRAEVLKRARAKIENHSGMASTQRAWIADPRNHPSKGDPRKKVSERMSVVGVLMPCGSRPAAPTSASLRATTRSQSKRNPSKPRHANGGGAGPSIAAIAKGLGAHLRHEGVDPKEGAKQIKAAMAREGALELANRLLDAHGIKGFSESGISIDYVNMGDTYDTTLIWDRKKRRYYVTSWGDYLEAAERRRR